MSKPGWTLISAVEMAKEFPYTFSCPSRQLIGNLQPGDFVRLMFELTDPGPDDPNDERMWVRITGRTGDSFTGDLDNKPHAIKELSLHDPIEFTGEHVLDANIDDPEPDPTERWRWRCLASSGILQDGCKVGLFYREAPQVEDDSGWRFMIGDETQAYLDEPDSIYAVTLGAVLRTDDRMLHLLDHKAPVAFEWREDAGAFVETDMPEVED